jgi:hypothetical protein
MSQCEQEENIKFCQKLSKPVTVTFQMIKQAYGEEALGCSAMFKWHKCFAQGRDSLEDISIPVGQEQSELNSHGRDSLEDDDHTGQPRTVRTELKSQEVATLVCANHSQMVDEIAAAAGTSHGTCHKILSDD